MYRSLPFMLTCLCLTLGLGCTSTIQTRKAHSAQFVATPKVAVLPFDNLTGQERAGQKITEYFQTMMAGRKKFVTIEYGDLFNAMRRLRVRSGLLITSEQIDSLKAALAIDYLVTGSVLQYEEHTDHYLGKVPEVAFNVRIIACDTRATAWTAVLTGSGDKGEFLFGVGAIRSADQLAENMVGKTIKRFSKALK